ncbi:MAG: 2-nitropropane dioxygenase [Bacteroidetes bacterium GWF2_41_61]|jgi:NAD(P)H-dependent flavin oxidoreductase YrpB (nitropropane dioxygenase family)|nr:MAG: 2-nitropropane dioxygenase [Bacteroidetes bacterium GWE2_40_15]OFY27383.1 MAG: 2-nitropropane dioxygenase [Bacteroidetes bacterium GWF2_41_61]PKP06571.1 MAG: nitronate monooxygenase [Bacteroidetes bacterium HGW-Bacteroidetes-5]HBZ24688.1 nitronate monooxygenase [Rikenellaceae bacterium]
MGKFSIGNLNLSVPIVQGGMGVGISLSGLASAVANEGGVGVISCAGIGLLYKNSSKDYLEASIIGLKEEIRLAKEKAKGVIGVNIMVALTNFADMVKTSIAAKADVIFAGAGLPLDLPSFLQKDSTTKLVPIVSSTRAALIICEKWIKNYNYVPDAIVLEGPKAGGHLGYKEDQISDEKYSLEELLPDLVKNIKVIEKENNCKIPIIAGGGIYSGADMKRVLDLGASAVQIGTRFVTTDECDASMAFKKSYLNAVESDIEIIRSPVGLPGRAIFSSFLGRVKEGLEKPKSCPFHCIRTCDYTKSPYCIIVALYNAFKGNFNKGYAFCGSNAFKADKIMSVKETIKSLMDEMKAAKILQKK